MVKFQDKSTRKPTLQSVTSLDDDEKLAAEDGSAETGAKEDRPARLNQADDPDSPAQNVTHPAVSGAGAVPPTETDGAFKRVEALPLPSSARPSNLPTTFHRPPARPPGASAPPASQSGPTSGAQPVPLSQERKVEPNPTAVRPAPTSAPDPRATDPSLSKGTEAPIASAAEIKPRHRGVMASFVLLVVLPVVATAIYLWAVAVDQYASTVGFSVRTEEVSSSLDLLGGITRLSGGGSADSDILYDYIHSQELVQDLNAAIDLRAIYSKERDRDPLFSFDPDGSIEDLVSHWERVVRITYDSSSRLMTLRVLAFTPEDATLIATKILERSTEKINALSDEARADATRYAEIEMDRALERLKVAREAMTRFRTRTQMVDPIADLQGQMGILNSLQAQLAESYVELDLLRSTTNTSDPRATQIEQRIAVITNRIEEERRSFSESGQGRGRDDYATLVAEFERLSVDREFAVQAYRVALAAYDSAQAEAQRQSRYLAAHIRPTQAEESEYPQRWTLLGLTGFFLFIAWAIGILIFYSIRDRR